VCFGIWLDKWDISFPSLMYLDEQVQIKTSMFSTLMLENGTVTSSPIKPKSNLTNTLTKKNCLWVSNIDYNIRHRGQPTEMITKKIALASWNKHQNP
jgi:hypothetical protein